jgi:SOS-response transcriptional repressor LexA
MINPGTVIKFKSKDLKEVRLKPGKDKIPINLYKVHAGRTNLHFNDMEQQNMDLRAHLIKNERLTSLFKVVSNSLEPEIRKEDLLIIDRKIASVCTDRQLDGTIIACVFEGESLVKKYKWDGRYGTLISLNPEHEPIIISDFHYFQIWGVTTFLIRSSGNFILTEPVTEFLTVLDEIEDVLDNKGMAMQDRILAAKKIIKKFKA